MKITVRKRRIKRLDPSKLRDAAEAAIESLEECVNTLELAITQIEPKEGRGSISAEKYAVLKRGHESIRFARATLTVLHDAAYPHRSRLAWNGTPQLRKL